MSESSPSAGVHAGELRLLAGGGIAGPLTALAPQLERACGRKVVFRFGTTPQLIAAAISGDPFDAAVTPREVFDDAAARARFVSGPLTAIARVGLGVAVRSGTAKPDIGTPEAFKRALIAARSIATVPESAAGAQIRRAFARLGIAEAIAERIRAQSGPAAIVEAVAAGRAELGLFLINVLIAPGLDLVGPFPGDLQAEVEFLAAVAARPAELEAARAFIAFLKSPEAAAVIKAKGMTPG